MRAQWPALRQRLKRFTQVVQGPWRAGLIRNLAFAGQMARRDRPNWGECACPDSLDTTFPYDLKRSPSGSKNALRATVAG